MNELVQLARDSQTQRADRATAQYDKVKSRRKRKRAEYEANDAENSARYACTSALICILRSH
jgi:hypothetical protein